jgi:hypothetical protein
LTSIKIGGSSKQCSGGGDSTAHSMESTISAVYTSLLSEAELENLATVKRFALVLTVPIKKQ